MYKAPILLLTVTLLLLLAGGALLGFERIVLDPAVYDRIQADIGHYDYIGLSPDAQSRVNIVLSDYLRGKRSDVILTEELFGRSGPVFNEDERAHMTDVLHLFRLERTVRTVCLAAGLFLLLHSVLSGRKAPARIAAGALRALLMTLLVLATAGVLLFVTSGFDRLFILFHELLFTNDLWLMDPRTDAMIRMFPSEFFRQIAVQAGVSALVSGLAFTAAAWLVFLAAGSLIQHPRRKKTP